MNKKHTTESVRALVEAEGYKLISEYENYNKHITVECPKGHTYPVYLGNFNRGYRCGYCDGNKPFTYKHIKEFVESKGYTLASTEYNRTHDLLDMICPSGHEYSVSFNSFKRGTRCSKCSASKGEHLIREILKGLLVEFKEQYRLDYNGNKFYYDFFIEASPSIFIEYDGIQHYNAKDYFGGEEGLKVIQQRDRDKTDLVENLEGLLIRVPYYLTDIEIYNLLVEKLSAYVNINKDWEFSIGEYNPKGYDYNAIAEHFKSHSSKETAEEFGVSLSFPSACFKKIHGISKKEYNRRN